MDWSNHDAWLQAKRSLWVLGDPQSDSYQVAGYTKEVRNLYFVVVVNSGHLLPMDQPEAAFEMASRFIRGESLADIPVTYPIDTHKSLMQELGLTVTMSVPPVHHAYYGYNPPFSLLQHFVTFMLGCVMALVVVSVWHRYYNPHRDYETIP
eukprot:scaffold10_cov257-Pinguiococcus_pyrenoidosus.AAC.49